MVYQSLSDDCAQLLNITERLHLFPLFMSRFNVRVVQLVSGNLIPVIVYH